MSRTLSEIYKESVETRQKYLELTEYHNDSKMSVINALTWVTSTAIFTFEKLLDIFMLDIATIFNKRINGTSNYYVNAMLKWQYGDDLVVNEEGTSFYYPNIDESKRIITYVSYHEYYNSHYKDDILILKVATGQGENLTQLTSDQLIAARAYLNQIKFAGVKCNVVSRMGDILVPKVTVYYDGAISLEELYDNIDESLRKFIQSIQFDSAIYAQKVIDAIQSTDHVKDVYLDQSDPDHPQGIFLAQYDDDNILGPLKKIDRKDYTSSGYAKESTKEGLESEIPTFRESIVVKLENESMVNKIISK